MSSIALLNSDGTVHRKLALVTLPGDYVIPLGMTVSWKTEIKVSSFDSLDGVFGPKHPAEAYFSLGEAFGQVCCTRFVESEQDDLYRTKYGVRDLTITVQGRKVEDVMELRDKILHIIRRGSWGVSNDLNPQPTFWQRFFKK